ncbi:SAM-dependent methlyltransferase [Dyella jiangningensis]|nr:SAM-dependent methlyltransferase [Dyella jiangningensis]AHX13432.1 SAM-dependent methlyltransferase [Dyella jiangningensis]
MDKQVATTGFLGDTKRRDYARKLSQFNRFAAAELHGAIASLAITPGARILDAGCGTGEALLWLREAAGDTGVIVGVDLAAPHLAMAQRQVPMSVPVIQADLTMPPFQEGAFDLIWSINTLNHLRDPLVGVKVLARLLRPGGRVAWGQSTLLPDKYFAWDARLERVINEAVRQYYRDKYGLTEQDLTATRALVGVLRRAGLRDVHVRTIAIERTFPLEVSHEAYVLETIFRGTWGERLRPYLAARDYAELAQLCDPCHARFALRRPVFIFYKPSHWLLGGSKGAYPELGTDHVANGLIHSLKEGS